MHTEIIGYSELANLLERSASTHQVNLDGMTLYCLNLAGRDVRVTVGISDTAVMFCSKADAAPVLHAISKPLPHLMLIQGGTVQVNA